MLGNLSGPTLIVILFIVLLLFGAPKLPGLAKSLGQSMRILKKEVTNDDKDGQSGDASGNNSNGSNKDSGTARNEVADSNGAEGDSTAGSGSAGSGKSE